MNNANAIALIETGALSTEKMLELCEKATFHGNPHGAAVVRAFVCNWKADNPLSSHQDLIDVIAGRSDMVQACFIKAVASDWNKEDFEYGFQKLSRSGDLIFAAGPSGKYAQEEVFAFSKRLQPSNVLDFWSCVVDANVLDAEGLYVVAMLDDQSWKEMQKLCLMVISKNKLSAEQLMNVCEKYKTRKEEAMAAIATGLLSDDQIVSLFSPEGWQRSLKWDEVAVYLHLASRTAEDLIALGEKVNSDELWTILISEISSKKS